MSLTLHAMRCGTIDMPAAMMMPGTQGRMTIPVMSYLIRHPKGDVVFDAGLGTSWSPRCKGCGKPEADALHKYVEGMHMSCSIEDDGDLSARLEAYDVDPRSVDYLVGSHLHFDHCGGFDLIPNAKLVMQRREWDVGREAEENRLHPFEYDLGHDRREVDGEHDLFGDGAVTCIPTYGHTPGHQSLRVKIDGTYVMLTSDACYLREVLEEMSVYPHLNSGDQESFAENLKLFRRLEAAGGLLLFGHDPTQWGMLNDDGAARMITTADIIGARALQSGAAG